MIAKIVLLFTAISLFMYSRIAFTLVMSALFPAIIAISVRKAIDNKAVASICAFNATGIMPHLTRLFSEGSIDDTARQLMYDSKFWSNCYGASLFGMLIIWLIPNIIAYTLLSSNKVQVSLIKIQQKRLIEEWGNDVSQSH